MIEPVDFEGGIVIEEDTLGGAVVDSVLGCPESCRAGCPEHDPYGCKRAQAFNNTFDP